MSNDLGRSLEEDIKKISEENHALLLEVYRLVKKINRHMVFDQVMSVIKIALILIPLWYAYTVLGPQLKQVYAMYSGLLSGEGSFGQVQEYQINQEVLKNLSPDVLNQLKKSGIIK